MYKSQAINEKNPVIGVELNHYIFFGHVMYKIFMLLILLISSPASSGWFGFGNSIDGAFGYELGETYHGPWGSVKPRKPLEGFSEYKVFYVDNKIYSISAVSGQSTFRKVFKALEKKYGKFKLFRDGYACIEAIHCGVWRFRDGNRTITITSPYNDQYSYQLSYLDIDLSNVRDKKLGIHDKYIGSDLL